MAAWPFSRAVSVPSLRERRSSLGGSERAARERTTSLREEEEDRPRERKLSLNFFTRDRRTSSSQGSSLGLPCRERLGSVREEGGRSSCRVRSRKISLKEEEGRERQHSLGSLGSVLRFGSERRRSERKLRGSIRDVRGSYGELRGSESERKGSERRRGSEGMRSEEKRSEGRGSERRRRERGVSETGLSWSMKWGGLNTSLPGNFRTGGLGTPSPKEWRTGGLYVPLHGDWRSGGLPGGPGGPGDLRRTLSTPGSRHRCSSFPLFLSPYFPSFPSMSSPTLLLRSELC